MEVFRITHKKWSTNLFSSGVAARWNSTGFEVIYSAASRSLACLENIVHRNSVELTENFAAMVIYVPDDAPLHQILVNDLPDNWYLAGEKYYRRTRPIGDQWLLENRYLILKAPSAIIRNEYNYLINPNHPAFDSVKLIATESFFFDDRIKQLK